MIVNHLNTFPYGGAATAGMRLHRQMLNDGIQSNFYFANDDRKTSLEPGVKKIAWDRPNSTTNPIARIFEKRRLRRIYSQYDEHIAGRDENLELFSMAELEQRTALPANEVNQQVFHLHWLAFMIDFPSFFSSIPVSTPIIWTLHDMNPLTGGCHYSSGCNRFVKGCGKCPLIQSPGPRDVSAQSFRIKKNALRKHNLNVVAPSIWLKELAQSSPVFPRSTTFHHIRLGFDLRQLFPMNKQAARKQLGLESEKILIGFGCESVGNHRKGFDLLVSALASLPDKSKVECVVFGSGNLPATNSDLPKIHHLGFINDPEQLTQFYSACDFVVVPSREDNQPQVGLEAMACGTPVVGFDIGGISEYVKPGITGWLARPENAADLGVQMNKLITDADSRKLMGQRCHQMMQQDFDIVKQSRKYQNLYGSLLDASARIAA